MRTSFGKPSPPSDDRRWKIIGATMRRHGFQPHALIEALTHGSGVIRIYW